MKIFNSIIGATTQRIYLRSRGLSGQFRYLEDFRKLSRLNSYDLARHQQKGLENILMHAYRNSDYYRRIFRELGATPMDFETFEKLREFPLLTREQLRENLGEIAAEDYPSHRQIKIRTSGTTDIPLEIYMDRPCLDKKNAIELFFNMRLGYRPGDRILCLFAGNENASATKPAEGLIRRFGSRKWYLDVDSIREEKEIEKAVRLIKKINPDIVFGYPNVLYEFARRTESCDKLLKMKKIVCSSEPLYEYQRDYLKKVFKARVYDRYGAREIGWAASECGVHAGMHYFAPGLIFEAVDNRGSSTGVRPGSLVVTDLWNYAVPLIRYKIGDYVRLDYTRCKCGNRLPKIGKVIGRVADTIIKPDGEMISGSILLSILRESELQDPIQIVQNDLADFVINYVSENVVGENIKRYISSSFARLFEQNVNIDFVQAPALEKDAGGTYRYIRSNVKSPLKT